MLWKNRDKNHREEDKSHRSNTHISQNFCFWISLHFSFHLPKNLGLYTIQVKIPFLKLSQPYKYSLSLSLLPSKTMTSKRSEVIRLRDILSKIPGVTKILWTELCAIVHDRLEKGKVRLSLYPPISFFSTLNLKQTKKSVL